MTQLLCSPANKLNSNVWYTGYIESCMKIYVQGFTNIYLSTFGRSIEIFRIFEVMKGLSNIPMDGNSSLLLSALCAAAITQWSAVAVRGGRGGRVVTLWWVCGNPVVVVLSSFAWCMVDSCCARPSLWGDVCVSAPTDRKLCAVRRVRSSLQCPMPRSLGVRLRVHEGSLRVHTAFLASLTSAEEALTTAPIK